MKKRVAQSIPSTSSDEAVYETTPRKSKYGIEDGGQEDDDDNDVGRGIF